MLGAEYQLLPESRLSLTFTRRRLKDMIEDMSVDEAATYFIGNPGQGIAANFPGARREYDAMTLVFQKEFSQTLAGAGQLHAGAAARATSPGCSGPRPASSIRTSTRTSIW